VILGLLGVKNHTDLALSMYSSHIGTMGAYNNLKGQASQFVILEMTFFKCSINFQIKYYQTGINDKILFTLPDKTIQYACTNNGRVFSKG